MTTSLHAKRPCCADAAAAAAICLSALTVRTLDA